MRSLRRVEYAARCHCGALTARYWTALTPQQWAIRACQCSFCRAHGALSTSDPAGSLQFSCAGLEVLQRYCFGTGTAGFLLCRTCGVYLGAQMGIEGRRWGILNVRTLTSALEGLCAPEAMNYENETAESRRLRRAARWTPLVRESL
jgi:hypothetical protein